MGKGGSRGGNGGASGAGDDWDANGDSPEANGGAVSFCCYVVFVVARCCCCFVVVARCCCCFLRCLLTFQDVGVDVGVDPCYGVLAAAVGDGDVF